MSENVQDMGDEGSSTRHLRDIRLVLYGRKWSGKTFTANTILGKEHFQLIEFTKNRVGSGEVEGKWRVQVVITPGWWKHFLPNETMELGKLQMIQGATAPSAPTTTGPHAVLLVIDVDTQQDEKSIKAAEEHLKLLGKEVLRHTIVLLNAGIWHEGDPTAREYMDQSGGFLGRIVRKCGGRYHLLNTDRNRPDQVPRLLEKVESMVAANGGGVFRVDAALALSTECRLRAVMEKATAREATIPTERNLLREVYKDHQLPEVRLLLLGWALSGKTTAVDTILNGLPGDGTTKRNTRESVGRRGRVGRWAVQAVDTPGWFRFGSVDDTPEAVKREIVRGAWLASPPGPHAVVLVVCACIAFSKAHLRAIQQHMALLGADVWRHALVLFNWCDSIGDSTVEQFIESEGRPLQWLLRRCGNRYHAFYRADPRAQGQVEGLLEKVEWMVVGNSLLQVHAVDAEEEEWEEEEGGGVVTEALPCGVPLSELFVQVCQRREEEFIESIRRIMVRPRKKGDGSIGSPPDMSEEEMVSNEKMVIEWLKSCNECDDERQSPISPTLPSLFTGERPSC